MANTVLPEFVVANTSILADVDETAIGETLASVAGTVNVGANSMIDVPVFGWANHRSCPAGPTPNASTHDWVVATATRVEGAE